MGVGYNMIATELAVAIKRFCPTKLMGRRGRGGLLYQHSTVQYDHRSLYDTVTATGCEYKWRLRAH